MRAACGVARTSPRRSSRRPAPRTRCATRWWTPTGGARLPPRAATPRRTCLCSCRCTETRRRCTETCPARVCTGGDTATRRFTAPRSTRARRRACWRSRDGPKHAPRLEETGLLPGALQRILPTCYPSWWTRCAARGRFSWKPRSSPGWWRPVWFAPTPRRGKKKTNATVSVPSSWTTAAGRSCPFKRRRTRSSGGPITTARCSMKCSRRRRRSAPTPEEL